jgi:ABC-2 type transport system permease protein
MVMGYIVAGMARALFIALLITVLGVVFVQTLPVNWGIYLLTIVMVAVLFSSLGIICGLLAEKFDHIALLTTFFITPLVFVGGVFTSTQLMPPLARTVSMFNPMFYMINAFRYSYTSQGDAPLLVSLGIVFVLAAVAFGTALRMMATGYKLRT